jgi:hypothetical protein
MIPVIISLRWIHTYSPVALRRVSELSTRGHKFALTPALRPASIRTLGEPSLARCMLGSECSGGRCNLDIGL